MEVTEIKKQLLCHIDKMGQDAKSLTKVLNYIESMGADDYNRLFIADEGLANSIKDDNDIIVPFVCDDMFEYIKDGESLSIGDFLSDKYKSERNIKDETAKAIKADLFFGLSLLEQDQRGKNLSNSIYSALLNGIGSGDIKIRDCVKDFLAKGDFPVIVTTIGFPIIESALSEKGYESEWYNPNQRNDLPFVSDNKSRVVYHIFGGATSNAWVYNEQTLLKYVHALHSGDFCAKNLANYLRGTGTENVKRPLVLGSTLPDWLFRFFVYPLYGDKLPESNGYWMSLGDIEKGLDMFLNRNKYTGQTNLQNENRVNEILSKATIEHNDESFEEQKPYKIFVSYKREMPNTANAEKIERIYDLLRKQAKATGGDVWRDIEQVADGGNPYWANIKKAIKECNLFVPLVSFPYLDEFLNAPNIDDYARSPILEASFKDANDDEKIRALNPVVREAYYAIAYSKKCAPIVIANQDGTLNGGTTEAIIKNSVDNRKIPNYIFGEHTNLVHNDNNPKFFNLPKID